MNTGMDTVMVVFVSNVMGMDIVIDADMDTATGMDISMDPDHAFYFDTDSDSIPLTLPFSPFRLCTVYACTAGEYNSWASMACGQSHPRHA
jgi:hypothetical protein